VGWEHEKAKHCQVVGHVDSHSHFLARVDLYVHPFADFSYEVLVKILRNCAGQTASATSWFFHVSGIVIDNVPDAFRPLKNRAEELFSP
jgi:hypothetical protein